MKPPQETRTASTSVIGPRHANTLIDNIGISSSLPLALADGEEHVGRIGTGKIRWLPR